MTRVLLTGGSGFLAAHLLEVLLKRGHSVVTSVRSQEKADFIKKAHPNYGKDKLDTVIVEDVADLHAFDQAVVNDPPFEAIIHTASPFHYNAKDIKRDMVDPAVNGTVGILRSAHKNAPTVKRVVFTSSFAAMWDQGRTERHTYTEKDWNPQNLEDTINDKSGGYRGSKKLAEQAAWEFVEKEHPQFSIATCCPPNMLGPVVQHLNSLNAVNTSNKIFRDLATGECKDKLTPNGLFLWVDVRDAALGHALAMEKADAGGKRFFMAAGEYSNRQLAEITYEHFPQLREKLPTGDALKAGDFPDGGSLMGFDNSQSKEVLGMTYSPLDKCVSDTIQSILDKM